MRKIIVKKQRGDRYASHGIGYTEHDGWGMTADNGWSIGFSLRHEERNINDGEQYQIEINGKNIGTFTKQGRS